MTAGVDQLMPVDWHGIVSWLQFECGLRPWEVLRLTLPEIAAYRDQGKESAPGGGPDMSDAEIEDYCQRYRAMSPRERLEGRRQGIV